MSEEQKNDGGEELPAISGEPTQAGDVVEMEIGALNKEIETLGKEVEDWRSRAYRAAADLDNFRKRALKDRDDLRKYAIEGVLKDLLPVSDNLERALAHAGGAGGALAEGVGMVHKQLLSALEKNGAKPFDPKGQPFDPQFHEAMSQLPRADLEPGTVIEVYQRGWMLHDRLVRPAMVIISAAAAPEATPAAEPAGDDTTEN